MVFSVVEARRNPYFNMVEMKNTGFYGKVCKSQFTSRQEAPTIYEMNASIYVYNPNYLSSGSSKTTLENKCGVIVMTDYLVLDIDSEDDYKMMNMLYTYCRKEDPELDAIYRGHKVYTIIARR